MNKWLVGLCVFIFACSSNEDPGLKFSSKGREVPSFNADSAYAFVDEQVRIGPRYPNSPGHRKVQTYLEEKLKNYAGSSSVFTQRFSYEAGYENDTLKLFNIIASFSPGSQDRIMLAAHYDTRPRADEDSLNPETPILGADDGGSGTAILIELARIFQKNPPPVGVDIVLFDGEDYGKSGDLDKYFLGSRYWAANPPVPGYDPRFGILLDMTGAKDAVFPKEINSLNYAPNLVNEVWNIAKEKSHESLFIDQRGARVQDDHVVVSENTGIPMINIIHHQKGEDGRAVFGDYWHTSRDDMQIISKETMNAVGEVLLELIYNRL